MIYIPILTRRSSSLTEGCGSNVPLSYTNYFKSQKSSLIPLCYINILGGVGPYGPSSFEKITLRTRSKRYHTSRSLICGTFCKQKWCPDDKSIRGVYSQKLFHNFSSVSIADCALYRTKCYASR